MPLFDSNKASTLASTDLGRPTVKGLGAELQAKSVESDLIKEKEAAAAVVIKVEGERIMGTKWTLVGGLKQVAVPTHHLGGERSKSVMLDLSDMSVFSFLTGAGRTSNKEAHTPGVWGCR